MVLRHDERHHLRNDGALNVKEIVTRSVALTLVTQDLNRAFPRECDLLEVMTYRHDGSRTRVINFYFIFAQVLRVARKRMLSNCNAHRVSRSVACYLVRRATRGTNACLLILDLKGLLNAVLDRNIYGLVSRCSNRQVVTKDRQRRTFVCRGLSTERTRNVRAIILGRIRFPKVILRVVNMSILLRVDFRNDDRSLSCSCRLHDLHYVNEFLDQDRMLNVFLVERTRRLYV